MPGHYEDFSNPFITEGTTNPNVLVDYVSGWQRHSGYEDDPDYYTAITDEISVPVSTPGYTYQGMGNEIMQALQNTFTLGTNEPFNPSMIAEANFDQQISDWLANQNIDSPGLHQYAHHPQFGGGYNWVSEMGSDEDFGWFNYTAPDWNPTSHELMDYVNIFDPQSIATMLSQMEGLGGEPIRAEEVQALTQDQVAKTTSAYYNPYEQAKAQGLTEKLEKDMMKVGSGGFAGSGARQSGLSGAERLYKSGYADVLAQIDQMQGQSLDSVLETIMSWQELAENA